MDMPPTKPIRDVLAAHLLPADPPTSADPLGRPLIGSCLIWQRSTDVAGYGRVTNVTAFGTRAPQLVHRVAYALSEGINTRLLAEIPVLDHLCRVHACAAPAHLEPVEFVENLRRGVLARTHCRNGHQYTPANTSIDNGARRCLDCKRNRYAASVGRPLMPTGRTRRSTV
jgi:hypothetical protein